MAQTVVGSGTKVGSLPKQRLASVICAKEIQAKVAETGGKASEQVEDEVNAGSEARQRRARLRQGG
jgi:hypothetical protein